MKTLEIVHLRMAGEALGPLVADIRHAGIDWEGTAEVRVYRHGRLTSDLRVHLHRVVPDGVPETSDFGTYLASILRIYGIVEHSVWVETD